MTDNTKELLRRADEVARLIPYMLTRREKRQAIARMLDLHRQALRG